MLPSFVEHVIFAFLEGVFGDRPDWRAVCNALGAFLLSCCNLLWHPSLCYPLISDCCMVTEISELDEGEVMSMCMAEGFSLTLAALLHRRLLYVSTLSNVLYVYMCVQMYVCHVRCN